MSEFVAINTQEEFDKAIAERIAREQKKYADYDELKKQSAELAELKGKGYEAKITGLETELENVRRSLAEKDKTSGELLTRAEKAEKSLLRRKVADAHKLPAGLADRIHGETKEEMNKDAEALSAFVTTGEAGAPLAGDNQTGTGGEWGDIIAKIKK